MPTPLHASDGPPAPAPKKLSAAQRRAHARTLITLTATVHEIGSDGVIANPVSGTTFDLSRGGVGLFVKRMIHPGKTLAIMIDLPGKPRTIYFGEARSCYYLSERQLYQIGVQFVPAPTTKAVREWTAQQAA